MKQFDGLRLSSFPRPPRVLITLEAFQTIRAFIAACPLEINGFGTVQEVGGDFLITDAFILQQRVTGVHAETDDRALHRLLARAARENVDLSGTKLQWHSHADMPARFSGEDLGTATSYMGDFMISLVMNKRGEYSCRLDIAKPFVVAFDVELELVLPPIGDDLLALCQQEIREKVQFPVMHRLDRWVTGRRDVPSIGDTAVPLRLEKAR